MLDSFERQLAHLQVDTLPNGRQLTYGEYRDLSRPLRRMLKQLGAGSLDEGLLSLRSQEAALQEVSHLIGVPDVVRPCCCSGLLARLHVGAS